MTSKRLPANCLGQQSTAVMAYSSYCVGAGRAEPLPEGTTFQDLFNPEFWGHHVSGPHALRAGDIVRVRARDGSFDCMLQVIATPKGGAKMEVWPTYPGGAGAEGLKAAVEAAEAARPKKIGFLPNGKPTVRTEHTPATKWRVIAIDQSELSRDHDTEEEARFAMDKYLKALGVEYPTAAEVAEKASFADEQAAQRREQARRQQIERGHARAPKG